MENTKFCESTLIRTFFKFSAKEFDTEIIVVSLGVDTFEKDPISFFKLGSGDFLSIGKLIAELELPTLFVMEGGYDIKELGVNVVNVLHGFEG